jgi:hypothetical protein
MCSATCPKLLIKCPERFLIAKFIGITRIAAKHALVGRSGFSFGMRDVGWGQIRSLTRPAPFRFRR